VNIKIFWSDATSGQGVGSSNARPVNLNEARRIWSDEVRGVKGNFLGLIDEEGRAAQFSFDANVPDSVDDASFLKIIRVDFPLPAKKGSFTATVTVREVDKWMQEIFKKGADPGRFKDLKFEAW
jgi:hypothetical protein